MIFFYLDNEPIVPLEMKSKNGEWLEFSVKFARKEFLAEISFSPSLGVGTNLLGLASFFDNFSVCFHHARKFVEVKEL